MKKLCTCLALIATLALVPRLVLSQVSIDSAEWKVFTPNAEPTGAVAIGRLNPDCSSSTNPDLNNGLIVNAIGSTVYLRTAREGAISANPSAAGGTIVGTFGGGGTFNKPVLVKLKDGKWYVFATCSDGKLYKIDVAGGATIAKTNSVSQIVSIRRASDQGCTVKDQITAAPIVQLASESNAGYTLDNDLVLVATHHGCSSSTTNMVYAFDAADITQPPLWVFNQFGDYAMDYCGNMILDTSRNAVFCVTNLNGGVSQYTIWRLNTVTGSLNWGANFGSVHSRLALGDTTIGQFNHLYAANMLGVLFAIDPETGAEAWHQELDATPGVFDDLPLTLGEGAYAGAILTTNSAGKIYAVFDDVESSEVLWSRNFPNGVKATTSCALLNALGKGYVGLSDGTVHQLNLANGSDERYCLVYATGTYPLLSFCAELEIYKVDMRYKLVVSQWFPAGVMLQYNVPGFVDNNHPDLNIWSGAMSTAWENPANWIPNRVPDSTIDVLISCGQIVDISSNAVCRSLEGHYNASVTVKPGFTLKVVH